MATFCPTGKIYRNYLSNSRMKNIKIQEKAVNEDLPVTHNNYIQWQSTVPLAILTNVAVFMLLVMFNPSSRLPHQAAMLPANSVFSDTDGDDGTTAAEKYGWTNLIRSDDFDGTQLDASWGVYDGPGHAGNGIRSLDQVSLDNGIMRITGTKDGITAGMSWMPGQLYGRWEVRARFPVGCGCYHPVLILWPDAEDFPVGGEVDYAEVFDPNRQELNFFLHYGADNQQISSTIQADMTQWHNFAVEWTNDHITGYIDGESWFHTDDQSKLPPRAMHQTLQLDWFPQDGAGTGAVMEVAWARMYGL